jgi:hypothetical protein
LESQSNIKELTDEIYPYADKLNELDMMFTKSRMLITNWVYLPYSIEDKEELVRVQEEKYPELKEELKSKLNVSFSEKDKVSLDSIFMGFESLIGLQQMIMLTLPDAPSYEDAIAIFDAEEMIEMEVLPQTTQLLSQLEELIVANKALAESKEQTMV